MADDPRLDPPVMIIPDNLPPEDLDMSAGSLHYIFKKDEASARVVNPIAEKLRAYAAKIDAGCYPGLTDIGAVFIMETDTPEGETLTDVEVSRWSMTDQHTTHEMLGILEIGKLHVFKVSCP